ncbi:unnamed protein product [Rotaria socialis]|uniref:Uncharacterized protein n=1 Tax=Rotaria socialis TaxID=392032 RepID=A0A821LWH3_9BILA|nr:unnamed protein product [Rotaria socialis]CAF3485772.1 unnamed protein product [Rotaria socialis]CAF3516314.1 unnamed protein product [Rotaria socialis]CAF3621931.1 unnamed protein product [Rotaria socialis]CAF4436823.1 unnamed protein product [Rotaria socialis]
MDVDSCKTTIENNFDDEMKDSEIQGVVVYANKLRHYAFIKRLDKQDEPDVFAREVSIKTEKMNPRFMISDKCSFTLKKTDRGYEAFNINIEKRSVQNIRKNKTMKINKNKENKLTNKDALFRSTILALFRETANSNKFEH